MDAPNKWEFGNPWQAVFLDGLSGKWLRLSNHGHAVASYEVAAWGSEQACIEAAWRYAYEPRADLCADPALLAEAVEVLDNLLEAISAETQHGDRCLTITGPTANLKWLIEAGEDARAFIAKLENRHDR